MPSYPGDDQFGSQFHASDILGDAGAGAGAGAAIGSAFSPIGTLIGGGIGALGGGIMGLIGDATAPSAASIYDQLMQSYYNSPEYQQEQDALTTLKGQTVQGPTAQESQALLQALDTANKQFGSSYGAIQQGAQARGGVGTSTQAALLASQGQGQASQMSTMATNAAGAESARRQAADQAYQQATQQALNMQDQYRTWASGQAYGRSTASEASTNQAILQGMNAIGSIGAKLATTPGTTQFGPNALAGSNGYTPKAGADALSFINQSANNVTQPLPPSLPSNGFTPYSSYQGPPQVSSGSGVQFDPNAQLPGHAPSYNPDYTQYQ